MPIAQTAHVHPTALLSPDAEIGDDVQIGPYVIIEGQVRIGSGCRIGAAAQLYGPLTMGCHNQVFPAAILGGAPQHLKYNGEPTRVEIGEGNIFREHVTVHRGTTNSWETRIGNNNFLMANAHVAHDCRIGNSCIIANGALLGGHCVLDDGVYLSGNSALHQFVRLGRLSLLSGVSATTKDIPPFIIQQRINCIVGVNVVGMKRAGILSAHIDAVRRAFHILYRQGLLVPAALAIIERDLGTVPEVAELVAFIRASSRGINLDGGKMNDAA